MNIEEAYNNIFLFVKQLFDSLLSIAKVIIKSKSGLILPTSSRENCIVLGNGPSLKTSLEQNLEKYKKAELICVNNFATAKEFSILKPKNYVILDAGYFWHKDVKNRSDTFVALNNKVDWPLNLFIPHMFRNDVDVKLFIKDNKFITVVFYNYVVFRGFKALGFLLFKKNLAMPQFNNVLGACILLAINMGFKKVYITGVDHSWIDNIAVNDDNVLCMTEPHFYDDLKPPLVPIAEGHSKTKTRNMANYFKGLYELFTSYYLLNDYAKKAGSTILNIGSYSYIDAFKRLKY